MRYGFSVARGSFSKGATTREFNAGEGRETKKNAKRSMLDQVRRIAQQYGEFIERDDERKSLYLSKIEREKKGWRNFAILGEKNNLHLKSTSMETETTIMNFSFLCYCVDAREIGLLNFRRNIRSLKSRKMAFLP